MRILHTMLRVGDLQRPGLLGGGRQREAGGQGAEGRAGSHRQPSPRRRAMITFMISFVPA